MFTRSQDSPATEFSNALVPGRKASIKQGGQIVLIFLYGNSGDSNRIFSDGFFAYMLQCKRSSTSLITIVWLKNIRFIASLLYGLKDVIASENSVFEVRIFDVAVLLRFNRDLKHQDGRWRRGRHIRVKAEARPASRFTRLSIR